ncbi:MAG: hypothetical protein Q9159_006538 [Coniocarpon cinnabarinum]
MSQSQQQSTEDIPDHPDHEHIESFLENDELKNNQTFRKLAKHLHKQQNTGGKLDGMNVTPDQRKAHMHEFMRKVKAHYVPKALAQEAQPAVASSSRNAPPPLRSYAEVKFNDEEVWLPSDADLGSFANLAIRATGTGTDQARAEFYFHLGKAGIRVDLKRRLRGLDGQSKDWTLGVLWWRLFLADANGSRWNYLNVIDFELVGRNSPNWIAAWMRVMARQKYRKTYGLEEA